jgi:hypothetical protein
MTPAGPELIGGELPDRDDAAKLRHAAKRISWNRADYVERWRFELELKKYDNGSRAKTPLGRRAKPLSA